MVFEIMVPTVHNFYFAQKLSDNPLTVSQYCGQLHCVDVLTKKAILGVTMNAPGSVFRSVRG